MFRDPDALRCDSVNTVQELDETLTTAYLLDDVGTELLDRQRADIASELTDDSVAETVVVQIENVLHDLGADKPMSETRTYLRRNSITHVVTIGVLHERQRVVRDLVHQLHALLV